MIARDLDDLLSSQDIKILGPAGSMDQALALVENNDTIHAALLDINLRGEAVYGLVDRLMDRQIPVIFVTGYDAESIPSPYRHIRRYEKPMPLVQIVVALEELLTKDTI